ncbi:MAG: hypothetical protein ALAOOOJD_02784 [bacterium]|nr:hypothetical protein [bacterium]
MTPHWPEGSIARMSHALILIVLQAILTFVIGFRIIATWIFSPQEVVWDGSGSSFLVAVILGTLSLAGILWFGLLQVGRLRCQDLGWKAASLWPAVVQGLLGFLVALIVVFGIAVLGGASIPDLVQAIAHYTWKQRGLFFLIGIQAALVEESLFRGYLQPVLVKRLGAVAGILLTAVVFAVYHLNFTSVSLIGKSLLGLIYGLLRERTNSLIPAGIAHFGVWLVIGSL